MVTILVCTRLIGTHACVLLMEFQYLYNLEIYGHKQYTRRDKSELAVAQAAVEARAASGDLGPLSPLA